MNYLVRMLCMLGLICPSWANTTEHDEVNVDMPGSHHNNFMEGQQPPIPHKDQNRVSENVLGNSGSLTHRRGLNVGKHANLKRQPLKEDKPGEFGTINFDDENDVDVGVDASPVVSVANRLTGKK